MSKRANGVVTVLVLGSRVGTDEVFEVSVGTRYLLQNLKLEVAVFEGQSDLEIEQLDAFVERG